MITPGNPRWSTRLVLWHWLCARLALATAATLVVLRPDGFVASPLTPTSLATAHVLVLGFLAISITGAWHAVAPLVLGVRHTTGRLDWWLFATLALVAAGVVSHMLLGTYSGVAWSAGLLLLLLMLRLPNWLLGLAAGTAPPAIAIGAALAWCSFVLTVCLGGVVAVNRHTPFLPVAHGTILLGHAHLGLGGFAALMVVSLGLRLLPMLLPATPPQGMGPWVAVLLTAAGGLGMGLLVPFMPHMLPICATLLGGGLMAFLLLAVGMLRHRQPAPRDRARPDPVLALAGFALVALLVALVLGEGIAFGAFSGPAVTLTYGVVAVAGFLGSIVLGVGGYLLPLVGWFAAFRERPELPRPPRTVGSPALGWITVVGWCGGVVAMTLAAGLTLPGLARGAAIAWLIAALSDSVNLLRGWRRRG